MVNKKFKRIFMVLTLCMTLMLGGSINAYAYVDESAGAEATTEAVAVEEELTVETVKEETGEMTTELEETEEVIKHIVDVVKNYEPDYDVDAICKELMSLIETKVERLYDNK